ncbi:hypothetical protein SDC9_83457 [bioreactor metagenome]|uniref:Uncharacterized protein n=1 Tax=bioreactor metagenome TaxID=1076179 RepID=A0A644ZDR9_9ZZZZ
MEQDKMRRHFILFHIDITILIGAAAEKGFGLTILNNLIHFTMLRKYQNVTEVRAWSADRACVPETNCILRSHKSKS